MSRPYSRPQPGQPQHKINGKIRAREVRVIGIDGQQVGVMDLAAAIGLARQSGVDLVEIAAAAVPPVCRIVDYGKFKYELSKKERDSKKHQHVSQVKEIQLSPRIDPHDLGIKFDHAVEFLCEDMKVKATLRFRGREMAHTEIGKGVMNTFLERLSPWGHPDFPPKLIGKSINVMVSPLPKNKRAKNPKEPAAGGEATATTASGSSPKASSKPDSADPENTRVATDAAESPSGFGQNPFAGIALPTQS